MFDWFHDLVVLVLGSQTNNSMFGSDLCAWTAIGASSVKMSYSYDMLRSGFGECRKRTTVSTCRVRTCDIRMTIPDPALVDAVNVPLHWQLEIGNVMFLWHCAGRDWECRKRNMILTFRCRTCHCPMTCLHSGFAVAVNIPRYWHFVPGNVRFLWQFATRMWRMP